GYAGRAAGLAGYGPDTHTGRAAARNARAGRRPTVTRSGADGTRDGDGTADAPRDSAGLARRAAERRRSADRTDDAARVERISEASRSSISVARDSAGATRTSRGPRHHHSAAGAAGDDRSVAEQPRRRWITAWWQWRRRFARLRRSRASGRLRASVRRER